MRRVRPAISERTRRNFGFPADFETISHDGPIKYPAVIYAPDHSKPERKAIGRNFPGLTCINPVNAEVYPRVKGVSLNTSIPSEPWVSI